jgi:hypothetical protein
MIIASICEPWVTYGKFLFCHAGIAEFEGYHHEALQDKKTSLQNLNGKDLIYDRILAAKKVSRHGITTEMIRIT